MVFTLSVPSLEFCERFWYGADNYSPPLKNGLKGKLHLFLVFLKPSAHIRCFAFKIYFVIFVSIYGSWLEFLIYLTFECKKNHNSSQFIFCLHVCLIFFFF